MRDICFVITEMLEELHNLKNYYSNLSMVLIDDIDSQLSIIRKRATTTAPEAMFLRWQELDQVVAFFIKNEQQIDPFRLTRETDFISFYTRKWE